MSSRQTIYEAHQRSKLSLLQTWKQLIKNIINSHELIYHLFKRDFLMAYKKSFIGIGWLLLAPVMGILSWVFMNITGILSPGEVGIPYPAYVLISTTIWGLFMSFFSGATETLTTATSFIMQVKFPHDVMLIKQAVQQLANFLINFIITLLVLSFFGVFPHWFIILTPFLILPLFFLGSSIGLLVSVVSIVAIDVKKGINFLMSLLMYISPVIYSADIKDPLLRTIMKYNPLTYLIGDMRDLIIFGEMKNLYFYLLSTFISIILFLFAWRIFFISEDKVVEKMI